MGLFDKMLGAMRLNADDEEDYDDDDFYAEDEDFYDNEVADRQRGSFLKRSNSRIAANGGEQAAAPSSGRFEKKSSNSRSTNSGSKITPMRQHKREVGGNAVMEVCVIKPNSVDDSREVADTLLDGRTVILNFEGFDLDRAQRIIDFIAGTCYAVRGTMKPVTKSIIIISPEGVEISGEDYQNFVDAFGVMN